jgi:hypothetical protein
VGRDTNISEQHAVSFFSVEDKYSMLSQNIGTLTTSVHGRHSPEEKIVNQENQIIGADVDFKIQNWCNQTKKKVEIQHCTGRKRPQINYPVKSLCKPLHIKYNQNPFCLQQGFQIFSLRTTICNLTHTMYRNNYLYI